MIMLWCRSSNTASPTTSSTVIQYPWVRKRSDFSTRSGVLSRPSRSESSPRAVMISRTLVAKGSGSGPGRSGWVMSVRSGRAGTVPLGAFIVDIVSGCLPETEPENQSRRQCGVKLAPADHGNILRSGNQGLKPGHVEIEILVVQVPQQAVLRQIAQFVEVHDIAGVRIDVAFDRQLQLVVVTVVVGIA